ncbi:hypothetical protein TCAL_01069 [Tigriopus californicus]|uniref:Sulfotransferase domain-containing protein n=2 Tax=Tigriopus californicus TaxID=6832 RepID=A0A553P4A2_TIGCA|nr:hypothetical protein TCAL_01069 [Tigriopus californicus]
MSLPYTLVPISEEEKAFRAKIYGGPKTCMVDMVVAQPYGIYLPKKFEKIAEDIYNMKIRPDDVFMIAFPKAGGTWNQELLWQLSNGLDFEKGKENLFFRSPFLELTCLCGDAPAVPAMDDNEAMDRMMKIKQNSVQSVADMPSPRVIKTHLPLEMLPPNLLDTAKVVWVNRNVNDSVVSFYHHEKLLPVHGLTASFEEHAKLYMEGKTLYGSYWTFMQAMWKHKDHPNLKEIKYEDMKNDLKGTIRNTAKFLGKDFPEEKVDLLVEHLSFETFKNNPAVNMKPPKGSVPDEVRDQFNFIRKGQVGDWKNYFQGDFLEEWNKWIDNNNPDSAIPMKFE